MVFAFYSAGLSGWVYDYPLALFGGILVALCVPLAMLLFKIPTAPLWNMVALWLGGGLMILRVGHGWSTAEVSRLRRQISCSERRVGVLESLLAMA